MVILCNDGTTVTQAGSLIQAREGTYILIGTILTGPGGFRSLNVKDMDVAVGIVCGRHDGMNVAVGVKQA